MQKERAEKAHLNRIELQWSDSNPALADKLYSKALQESYQEEVRSRIAKWHSHGKGDTPFEQSQRDAAAAEGDHVSTKYKEEQVQ